MVDRDRLMQAVNYLVASEDYARLSREIADVVDRWQTRPMVYAGDLAVLNALIDIGTENPAAYARIIKLVEDKRKLVPQLKRTDYQRELMAQRRARINMALELHELAAGRKIPQSERPQFTRDIQARWSKERDAYILEKGDLDWHGRNAATKEFWERLDATLEANLEDARRKVAVP